MFGDKVRFARNQLNLTQEQLANKCHVTRQTIHLIEKNHYNPTLNLCRSIAKSLNQTLDELFWEDELGGNKK